MSKIGVVLNFVKCFGIVGQRYMTSTKDFKIARSRFMNLPVYTIIKRDIIFTKVKRIEGDLNSFCEFLKKNLKDIQIHRINEITRSVTLVGRYSDEISLLLKNTGM